MHPIGTKPLASLTQVPSATLVNSKTENAAKMSLPIIPLILILSRLYLGTQVATQAIKFIQFRV